MPVDHVSRVVRWGAVAAVAGCLLAGCGGGDEAEPAARRPADTGSPSVIDAPAPPGTAAGARVASQAGCLACHRIGAEGNDGPGPALTRVGARLDRPRIERTLRSPEAPMPSYRRLPRRDFDALVDYLVALR